MIAGEIEKWYFRLRQRPEYPADFGEFPGLTGTGQIAGADDYVRTRRNDVFNCASKLIQIVPETAPETVIEYSNPAFIKVSEKILRRTAGMGIGKVYYFQNRTVVKGFVLKIFSVNIIPYYRLC